MVKEVGNAVGRHGCSFFNHAVSAIEWTHFREREAEQPEIVILRLRCEAFQGRVEWRQGIGWNCMLEGRKILRDQYTR